LLESLRSEVDILPWRIEWHASLPSTMTRARELAETGAPAGTVVVADYQSEGRGTRGRAWLAPPGTCLMFTIVARPRMPAGELEGAPLRVSESIATTLRAEFDLPCEVKPPNDVMIDGRKLCGILCASRLMGEQIAWLLVGVGLNTRMSLADRPLETATSLQLEGIAVPAHCDLLRRALARLEWLLETA
jgi:BirA family biotin operon repressor/biotin-[acetyl-CoA-carboxylase] ligase